MLRSILNKASGRIDVIHFMNNKWADSPDPESTAYLVVKVCKTTGIVKETARKEQFILQMRT